MAEASRRPPLRAVPADAPPEAPAQFPVRDPRPGLIAVARRHWLALLAAFVLGALAGLVLSQLQTPRYSASGRLFLVDPNRDFGLDPDRAPYTDPLRFTRTRAELVASTPVFQRVASRLGTTADDVRDRVKVLPSRESDLVNITAVGDSPEDAEQLVSLVQRAYSAVTTSAQQAPYRSALEQVQRDRAEVLADLRRVNEALEEAPGSAPLLAERALLQEHYRFLRDREATLAANAGLLGSGVQLAEPPVAEPVALSPRPARNAAIGAMLGSVLLLGLLWWRSGRVATANAPDVVEPILGAPLLVELPPAGSGRGSRGFTDAFDQLAATLASTAHARVVLVSPVSEADWRPAIPLWIAAALGRGDRRVVVVDAAGTGALSDSLGGRNARGLSELGDGSTSVAELVEDVEIAPGTSVPVLGSGRYAAAPDRTAKLARALPQLLAVADAVVVDAPAGRGLATAVTGVQTVGVVVATPTTELGALAGLRRELDLLGVPALGFVFVRGRLPGDRPARGRTAGAGAWLRAATGRARDRLRR